MADRLARFNELLIREISHLLQHKLDLSDGSIVTISRASASTTLEHATIWLSVYPSQKSEAVLKRVNKVIMEIQRGLNVRLKIRTVPKLRFKIDSAEDHAEHIESLLKEPVQ